MAIGFSKGYKYVAPILPLFRAIELCSERNPQITYIDLLRGVRCVSTFSATLYCVHASWRTAKSSGRSTAKGRNYQLHTKL
jgi:hypothetical protein